MLRPMTCDTYPMEIMKLESTLIKMCWCVHTMVCTCRASLHQHTTCGWRDLIDRWHPLPLGSSILNEQLNVWTFLAKTKLFWTHWVWVWLGWKELVSSVVQVQSAQELLTCQGIPVHNSTLTYAGFVSEDASRSNDQDQQHLLTFKDVGAAAIRKMAGNTFNLCCSTSFLAFTLAMLQRK